MPLISVIVPVYKVEPYLHQCIDSILTQTFTDFELILVDDGSPDGCGAICDEYMAKDNRIITIHKPNGGLSDARNAGLEIAVGEYISFIDSDDFVETTMFSTSLEEIKNKVDLVCFGYSEISDIQEERKYLPKECLYKYDTSDDSVVKFFINTLLCYRVPWSAWSKIYLRSIIENNSIRFEDNKRIFAEDLYFSLCYCAQIKSVKSIEKSLYNYRVRETSIMGQNINNNNLGRMSLLSESVYDYFKEHHLNKLLGSFPAIHFMIIKGELLRLKKTKYIKEIEAEKKIISNWQFFKSNTSQAKKYKRLFPREKYETDNLLIELDYLISGNYPFMKLRKLLLRTEFFICRRIKRVFCNNK